MKSTKQEEKKVMHANSQEIADWMADEKKKLMEPGAHNILIYNDLKAFREIYSQYSRALLAENEIVVIATQYDTISDVKNTLRLGGIDVEKYLSQETLFIIDAQQGYQDADGSGIWKLYKSLISRAKKEGRRGVTFFGDLGSFFGFEKIEELMQYELSLPQNYEDTLKGICCYHLKDFENLSETQQQTLFDHHFKSMSVE
jgi:MEDS: MEthanogen/methylotroph, DcmR Sensory domain